MHLQVIALKTGLAGCASFALTDCMRNSLFSKNCLPVCADLVAQSTLTSWTFRKEMFSHWLPTAAAVMVGQRTVWVKALQQALRIDIPRGPHPHTRVPWFTRSP